MTLKETLPLLIAVGGMQVGSSLGLLIGMPLPSSQFITMEYSSGSIEEMENRLLLSSSLYGDEMSLPIRHGNRSGPLRTVRRKAALY